MPFETDVFIVLRKIQKKKKPITVISVIVETDFRRRKGLEEFVFLLVEEEGIKTAKSRKPSSQTTVADQ